MEIFKIVIDFFPLIKKQIKLFTVFGKVDKDWRRYKQGFATSIIEVRYID